MDSMASIFVRGERKVLFSPRLTFLFRRNILIMMSDTLLYPTKLCCFLAFYLCNRNNRQDNTGRVIGWRGYKFENFAMRIMLSILCLILIFWLNLCVRWHKTFFHFLDNHKGSMRRKEERKTNNLHMFHTNSIY